LHCAGVLLTIAAPAKKKHQAKHQAENAMQEKQNIDLITIASCVLAGLALLLILKVGLLASLLSGMLVYSLVHILAPMLGRRIGSQRAKVIAVTMLVSFIVLVLVAATWSAISFFQNELGGFPHLMQRLADILEASRNKMPPWLSDHIPDSAEALREMIAAWLREHSSHAQTVGEEAGRTIAHILIGMVIGAMAALYDTTSTPQYKPLAAALHARIVNLQHAFESIVFAQVRIAGINAALTAVYLMVILPLAGVKLPLSKSMVLLTFVFGLLPVIGNLISNALIVIISLSHSLEIALASLVFLVVIHKLEYFLNARIIGSHINARAWELLAAMLAMEAVFGLHGVVAAPVYYAYLKKELSDSRLV
jgi:predicted PurR-regulated permease PerM